MHEHEHEHEHECVECGHVWQHEEGAPNRQVAHTCPSCRAFNENNCLHSYACRCSEWCIQYNAKVNL